MEPQKRSRLCLFAGIVAVIIVLHIIVLSVVVGPSSGKEGQAEPEKSASGSAAVENKSQKQASEKKTQTPVSRYRKKSTSPVFGKALDYLGARRGVMPWRLVPGDSSTSGILVDMQTRKVLWEKNSRKALPVASMSKMMTMLLTMEHLEKHPELSLATPVKISRDVLRLPSREGIVWLDPRETFPLSDLIKCAAVKSANDAALQLALTVAGSEEAFVRQMNLRARQIGMTGTRFINAHGLPDKRRNQSLSTAHDMILLGERMLEYPFIMGNFKTLVTSIRQGDKKTIIRNTNRLIRKNFGDAEGMKTGFTRKAGFCLTFSVMRNNRRLMGCVTGFKTAIARDRFCKALIDWAYEGCPDRKAPPARKGRTARRQAK